MNDLSKKARGHALALEQCSIFVETDCGIHPAKAMIDNAAFIRDTEQSGILQTDLIVELESLRDKVTDEDLNESGRYFHDRSYGDLTRCNHGDTGEFLNDADGQAIAILWNQWRQNKPSV